MVKRPKKARVPVADFVPIVGDAAIAGPIAEGVLIPVVILDTSNRPDIAEVIRVNQHLPGDVSFTWGGIEGHPDDVLLVLDFERPIEARAVLRFSIEKQGILVESAVTAKAIYLQVGRQGDRLIHDLNRPKMLVELPDGEFRSRWNLLFLHRMTVVLSRRFGWSRRKAEPLARELIAELRKMTMFRMPR
ncbi:MAG: hypothetical protein ACRDTF_22155 [Pseudonocardiaceae bacterium]